MPFDEEWNLWVNFYAPRRPETYNFHESFQLPDPEVSRTGHPKDLRKGYLRVSIATASGSLSSASASMERLLAVEFFIEVLVVGEEQRADMVLAFGDDGLVHHVARGSGEGAECAIRLGLEIVAVGEEEDAVVAQHTTVDEFPNELKDGESLARARRHEQECAGIVCRKAKQRVENCGLLIRAHLFPHDLVDVPRIIEHAFPLRPIELVPETRENVLRRLGLKSDRTRILAIARWGLLIWGALSLIGVIVVAAIAAYQFGPGKLGNVVQIRRSRNSFLTK